MPKLRRRYFVYKFSLIAICFCTVMSFQRDGGSGDPRDLIRDEEKIENEHTLVPLKQPDIQEPHHIGTPSPPPPGSVFQSPLVDDAHQVTYEVPIELRHNDTMDCYGEGSYDHRFDNNYIDPIKKEWKEATSIAYNIFEKSLSGNKSSSTNNKTQLNWVDRLLQQPLKSAVEFSLLKSVLLLSLSNSSSKSTLMGKLSERDYLHSKFLNGTNNDLDSFLVNQHARCSLKNRKFQEFLDNSELNEVLDMLQRKNATELRHELHKTDPDFSFFLKNFSKSYSIEKVLSLMENRTEFEQRKWNFSNLSEEFHNWSMSDFHNWSMSDFHNWSMSDFHNWSMSNYHNWSKPEGNIESAFKNILWILRNRDRNTTFGNTKLKNLTQFSIEELEYLINCSTRYQHPLEYPPIPYMMNDRNSGNFSKLWQSYETSSNKTEMYYDGSGFSQDQGNFPDARTEKQFRENLHLLNVTSDVGDFLSEIRKISITGSNTTQINKETMANGTCNKWIRLFVRGLDQIKKQNSTDIWANFFFDELLNAISIQEKLTKDWEDLNTTMNQMENIKASPATNYEGNYSTDRPAPTKDGSHGNTIPLETEINERVAEKDFVVHHHHDSETEKQKYASMQSMHEYKLWNFLQYSMQNVTAFKSFQYFLDLYEVELLMPDMKRSSLYVEQLIEMFSAAKRLSSIWNQTSKTEHFSRYSPPNFKFENRTFEHITTLEEAHNSTQVFGFPTNRTEAVGDLELKFKDMMYINFPRCKELEQKSSSQLWKETVSVLSSRFLAHMRFIPHHSLKSFLEDEFYANKGIKGIPPLTSFDGSSLFSGGFLSKMIDVVSIFQSYLKKINEQFTINHPSDLAGLEHIHDHGRILGGSPLNSNKPFPAIINRMDNTLRKLKFRLGLFPNAFQGCTLLKEQWKEASLAVFQMLNKTIFKQRKMSADGKDFHILGGNKADGVRSNSRSQMLLGSRFIKSLYIASHFTTNNKTQIHESLHKMYLQQWTANQRDCINRDISYHVTTPLKQLYNYYKSIEIGQKSEKEHMCTKITAELLDMAQDPKISETINSYLDLAVENLTQVQANNNNINLESELMNISANINKLVQPSNSTWPFQLANFVNDTLKELSSSLLKSNNNIKNVKLLRSNPPHIVESLNDFGNSIVSFNALLENINKTVGLPSKLKPSLKMNSTTIQSLIPCLDLTALGEVFGTNNQDMGLLSSDNHNEHYTLDPHYPNYREKDEAPIILSIKDSIENNPLFSDAFSIIEKVTNSKGTEDGNFNPFHPDHVQRKGKLISDIINMSSNVNSDSTRSNLQDESHPNFTCNPWLSHISSKLSTLLRGNKTNLLFDLIMDEIKSYNQEEGMKENKYDMPLKTDRVLSQALSAFASFLHHGRPIDTFETMDKELLASVLESLNLEEKANQTIATFLNNNGIFSMLSKMAAERKVIQTLATHLVTSTAANHSDEYDICHEIKSKIGNFLNIFDNRPTTHHDSFNNSFLNFLNTTIKDFAIGQTCLNDLLTSNKNQSTDSVISQIIISAIGEHSVDEIITHLFGEAIGNYTINEISSHLFGEEIGNYTINEIWSHLYGEAIGNYTTNEIWSHLFGEAIDNYTNNTIWSHLFGEAIDNYTNNAIWSHLFGETIGNYTTNEIWSHLFGEEIGNYTINEIWSHLYGEAIGNYTTNEIWSHLFGEAIDNYTNNAIWSHLFGEAIDNYTNNAIWSHLFGETIGNYTVNAIWSHLFGGTIGNYTINEIWSHLFGEAIDNYTNDEIFTHLFGEAIGNYTTNEIWSHLFGEAIGNYTINKIWSHLFGEANGNYTINEIWSHLFGEAIGNYTINEVWSHLFGEAIGNYTNDEIFTHLFGEAIGNYTINEIWSHLFGEAIGNYTNNAIWSHLFRGTIGNYTNDEIWSHLFGEEIGNFTINEMLVHLIGEVIGNYSYDSFLLELGNQTIDIQTLTKIFVHILAKTKDIQSKYGINFQQINSSINNISFDQIYISLLKNKQTLNSVVEVLKNTMETVGMPNAFQQVLSNYLLATYNFLGYPTESYNTGNLLLGFYNNFFVPDAAFNNYFDIPLNFGSDYISHNPCNPSTYSKPNLHDGLDDISLFLVFADTVEYDMLLDRLGSYAPVNYPFRTEEENAKIIDTLKEKTNLSALSHSLSKKYNNSFDLNSFSFAHMKNVSNYTNVNKHHDNFNNTHFFNVASSLDLIGWNMMSMNEDLSLFEGLFDSLSPISSNKSVRGDRADLINYLAEKFEQANVTAYLDTERCYTPVNPLGLIRTCLNQTMHNHTAEENNSPVSSSQVTTDTAVPDYVLDVMDLTEEIGVKLYSLTKHEDTDFTVTQLPDSGAGNLEYKDPRDVAVSRLVREWDIPSKSPISDSFCSPGWNCLTIGTTLKSDSVIRFRLNKTASFAGMLRIGLLPLGGEKELSIGLLVLSLADRRPDPASELIKDFDEDSIISSSQTDEINMNVNDDEVITLEMSDIAESLAFPIQDLQALHLLRNSSDAVRSFFQDIDRIKSTVYYVVGSKLLKDFQIIFQDKSQAVVNNRIIRTLKAESTETRQTSLLLRSKSRSFEESYVIFVKYPFATHWTKYTIQILPLIKVNSKLTFTGRSLIPVPFSMDDYHGYAISDVANSISYAVLPRLKLGIVMTKIPTNRYGNLQFRCNGEKFKNISSQAKLVFLSPTCNIRFLPNSNETFWQPGEVNVRVRILDSDGINYFLFDPDISPSIQQYKEQNYLIVHNCTWNPLCEKIAQESHGLLSNDVVDVIIERIGCDGMKSTWPAIQFDECGVCGGKNDCFDCAGIKHGKARHDECGICSGGDTSKRANKNMDCSLQCFGKSVRDNCGVCLPVTDPNFNKSKDCNGECFKATSTHECSDCSVVKDECGVCGGNGSSCMGCDGKPYSKFRTDQCGKCLNVDDVAYNQGCPGNVSALRLLAPFRYVDERANLKLIVTGRFSSYDVASCTLTGSAYVASQQEPIKVSIPLRDHEIMTKTYVKKRLDSHANEELDLVEPGFQYSVLEIPKISTSDDHQLIQVIASCDLTSPSNKESVYSAVFKTPVFFQRTAFPLIKQLHPGSFAVTEDAVTVVVTGGRFHTNLEYVCAVIDGSSMGKANQESISSLLKGYSIARMINETNVECKVPGSLSSGEVSLFLFTNLELGYIDDERIKNYNALKFLFREKAPAIVESRLSDDLRYISIKFDQPIKRKHRYSCNDILHEDSLTLLGTEPLCFVWEKDKILILPSPRANFLQYFHKNISGDLSLDRLKLLEDAVTGSSELGVFENFPSTSVDVFKPRNTVKPEVVTFGRSVLGQCDEPTLKYEATKGVGPWPFKLWWTLVSVDASNAINHTSTEAKGARTFQFDSSWKDVTCHLQVENVLGVKSEIVSHKFSVTSEPYVLSVAIKGSKRRKISSSKYLYLKASASVVAKNCGRDLRTLQSVRGTIAYRWQVETSPQISFSLNVANIRGDESWKPKLFIPEGLLTPSVIYNFTITAIHAEDEENTQESHDSVLVEVLSQPLEAIIRNIYSDGLVNSSDTLVLDGSQSYDPNRSPDPLTHEWTCLMLNGASCLIYENATSSRLIRAEEVFRKISGNPGLVEIPANLFPPNQIYNFTLAISKDTKRSYKSIVLEIKQLPSNIPRIRFQTSFSKEFSTNKKLRIKAVISTNETAHINEYFGFLLPSGKEKNTGQARKLQTHFSLRHNQQYFAFDLRSSSGFSGTLTWHLTTRDGDDHLSSLEESTLTRISKKLTLIKEKPLKTHFVLKRNVLTPGQTYEVSVTMAPLADASEDVASASLSFVTASKPISGTLQVEPINGTALLTDFALRTSGWSKPTLNAYDGYIPESSFLYKFGYFQEESGVRKFILLQPYSADFATSAKLPPALGNDNSLELIVFVKNQDDESDSNSANATVTIKVESFKTDEEDEILNDVAVLVEESLFTGNRLQAAAYITSIGQTISATDSVKRDTVRKMADNFTQTLTGFSPKTKDDAVETLQSTYNVLSLVPVSEASSAIAAKLPTIMLEEFFSKTGSRKKRQVESVDSSTDRITVEESEIILQTYDVIFESGTSSSYYLIAPREEFAKAVDEISAQFCQVISSEELATEIETPSSKLDVAHLASLEVDGAFGQTGDLFQFSSKTSNVFGSWSCSNSEQCAGSCVAVGIFSNDVVTWYRTDKQEERKSDILLVSVRNPISGIAVEDMLPSNQASSLSIVFQQVNKTNSLATYECLRWTEQYVWEKQCNLTSTISNADQFTVTCECSVAYGYFAIFSVPLSETTTVESTTGSTTTLTTVCAHPLVAKELCSSDCIPKCNNIENTPLLCTQRCVPSVECVCPQGQVLNGNNHCVTSGQCESNKEAKSHSVDVLLIGIVAGCTSAMLLAGIFAAYKFIQKKKQCRVGSERNVKDQVTRPQITPPPAYASSATYTEHTASSGRYKTPNAP